MNSKQRRKFNRTQNHTITVYANQFERYASFDEETIKARSWCKKKCKGTYYAKHDWDKTIFSFSLERDAVFFALKWL